MIQIFHGCEPNYQHYYDDIKKMLVREHCIHLSEPLASDIYIYWGNPDYFANGCVRLTRCEASWQYILKNITFHVDFNLYERELDNDDYDAFSEQMGIQFYKAVYGKLFEMVNIQAIKLEKNKGSLSQQISSDHHDLPFPTLSNTQLLMELSDEELSDCIIYGCWPCDAGNEVTEDCYRSTLSLTPQDRIACLNNLKKFDANFDDAEDA